MAESVPFEALVGKTLTEIHVDRDDDPHIVFGTADGTRYRMHHDQDCCEHVYIEDIDGDIEDLIGDPILLAEEASGSNDPPLNEHWESHTWTFYKLRNIKASITIRWFGCSNGYYSESVSFVQLDD